MKPCRNGHAEGRYANGKCKGCRRASHRKWRHANPEKNRTNARKWTQANPEKKRANSRKWRRLPEATRPAPMLCEVCGGPPKGHNSVLSLDHDHATGAFRGWLCNKCNVGIGALGDTLAGALRAVEYLKRTTNEES
jgi:hypothetical protein